MTSKFVEIVQPSHRQGNLLPSQSGGVPAVKERRRRFSIAGKQPAQVESPPAARPPNSRRRSSGVGDRPAGPNVLRRFLDETLFEMPARTGRAKTD